MRSAMLRYRVQSRRPKYPYPSWTPREAFVVLDAGSEDERARYEVEGDPELAATIKDVLAGCCGLDGHLLQEFTTPHELHAAMLSPPMRPYEAEIIEGAEIIV